MRRASPPEIPGLDVLARLHSGGMGDVFLARRVGPAHPRFFALKRIRPELARDPEVRAMFLDEARVLAHLDHPAVARVEDFGEASGAPYLLMEYVAGRPLGKLEGPVPPAVAARMIAEVARGLHAVHEADGPDGRPLEIVHRDISPQNLMLGFDGRMKLLDFGIALVAERAAPPTSTGLVKGKITYVAPEQITGARVDRRSDVYGLAVVLHELLTSRPLFRAQESPLAAAEERRRPPRPSRTARVPRRLDRVVLRGLAFERQARFPTARDFAEALEAFANRAGGPSLEGWAESELSAARARHDAWLAEVSAPRPEGPPLEPNRPVGGAPNPVSASDGEVGSAPGLEVEPALIEAEAPVEEPLQPTAAAEARPGRPEGAKAAGRFFRRVAALALLASAGLVGFAFATGRLELPLRPGSLGAPAVPVEPAAAEPESTAALESEPRGARPPEAPETPPSEPPGAPDDEPRAPEPAKTSRPPPASKPPPEAPAETPAEAPAKTPAEVPAEAPSERTESPQRAGRWGRLTVRARAGGWILVDGQPFGRTPLLDARIRAGRYRVALRRSGDEAPRWSSEVTVPEGRHVRIRLQ